MPAATSGRSCSPRDAFFEASLPGAEARAYHNTRHAARAEPVEKGMQRQIGSSSTRASSQSRWPAKHRPFVIIGPDPRAAGLMRVRPFHHAYNAEIKQRGRCSARLRDNRADHPFARSRASAPPMMLAPIPACVSNQTETDSGIPPIQQNQKGSSST